LGDLSGACPSFVVIMCLFGSLTFTFPRLAPAARHLALLLLFSLMDAACACTLRVDTMPVAGPLNLTSCWEALEDSSHKLTIDDVTSPLWFGQFVRPAYRGDSLNFGTLFRS
jgi:hypothetical protein